MATPLQNLQTAYAQICAQLADMTASPKPSYSNNGRSISWGEHFNSLMEAKKKLEDTPGVAPDQHPVFEVLG